MRRRGRPPHPDILTPREWEVLSLIEQGASNDEIAQRLGVTERTAKYHVSEILSKLGVSSREEAVAAIGQREPVRMAGAFGQWALAFKVAAMVVAAGVLAGVAFLAWTVVESGDDGEAVPAMSLDETYTRALAGATRADELLHSSIDIRVRGVDGESQLSFGEMWLDVAADAVRVETHPGPDWRDKESNGEDLIISTAEFDYHENRGGDAYRTVVDSRGLCPGTLSAVLRNLLACGGARGTERTEPRVISDAEWEGRPAVAVVMFDGHVVETFETPTPGDLTVTPQPTAGQATVSTPPAPGFVLPSPDEYDFASITYLDTETFLPFATTYSYEYDDARRSFTYTIRYGHEFIDRSSLPADYFDPASIGWRGG